MSGIYGKGGSVVGGGPSSPAQPATPAQAGDLSRDGILHQARTLDTEAARLLEAGHTHSARSAQHQAVDLFLRALGPEHPDTLAARHRKAHILVAEKHYATAESEYRDLCDDFGCVLGLKHPDTLAVRAGLADVLRLQEKFEEADAESAAVLMARMEILGPDHPDTLTSRYRWAMHLYHQRDYGGAETHHRAVLEARLRVLRRGHPEKAQSWLALARVLEAQGRHREAVELLRQASSFFRHEIHSLFNEVYATDANIARCLMAQGELAGARRSAVFARDGFLHLLGPQDDHTRAAGQLLLGIEAAWRRQGAQQKAAARSAKDHGEPAGEVSSSG